MSTIERRRRDDTYTTTRGRTGETNRVANQLDRQRQEARSDCRDGQGNRNMLNRSLAAMVFLCVGMSCYGQASSFDAATAFGARPGVSSLHLSPDGTSVTYIAPAKGQGTIAYTLGLAKGSVPKVALSADGKPYRLDGCHWVSNDRLVCLAFAVLWDPAIGPMKATRTVAVDADGKNLKVLSTRQNEYSRGYELGGGSIIDWLPMRTAPC
jgi:hypothetical protein